MFSHMTRDQLAGWLSGILVAVVSLLVILDVISEEVAVGIGAILAAALGGYAVDNHGAARAKEAVQSAVDAQTPVVQVPVEVPVSADPEAVLEPRPVVSEPETIHRPGEGFRYPGQP